MAELVDAEDLKSFELSSCGFDSRYPYHFYVSAAQVVRCGGL